MRKSSRNPAPKQSPFKSIRLDIRQASDGTRLYARIWIDKPNGESITAEGSTIAEALDQLSSAVKRTQLRDPAWKASTQPAAVLTGAETDMSSQAPDDP